MSSSGRGIGSTLTGGIQDTLPQRSYHCSGLNNARYMWARGYLYAASSPMSILGNMWSRSQRWIQDVGWFSYGDIEGAKIFGNMGFEPRGKNLQVSLIMVESGKGENKERYIIENRIDALINELNIQVDENQITGYLTSQRLGISRDSIRVVPSTV